MLTKKRQQQIIADLLGGLIQPDDIPTLKDPYDYIVDLIVSNNLHNVKDKDQQKAFVNLSAESDLSDILSDIFALKPGVDPPGQYPSLAEIGPQLPPTTWLWPGWIPRGYLTLLAAWPGVGKTYLALDLANRLLSCQRAPDDIEFQTRNNSVIFVDAEDFLPQIYERVSAWGMNTERFYPVRKPPRELLDMTKQEYQDDLIDMCHNINPDLIIVDSLSSVNSRGENNIEDIRDVLNFFAEIPQAFGCSLVLIHHPRKPGRGITQSICMHDLRGSGHLIAMGRSILGMDVIKTGPDDNPNGPRQLKALKANLAPFPKPLSVQYSPSPQNADVAALSYGPIELFASYPETLQDKCSEWLLNNLQDGPLSYQEIIGLAHKTDFSETTIQAARKLLGDAIADTLGPRRKGNKWTLTPDT